MNRLKTVEEDQQKEVTLLDNLKGLFLGLRCKDDRYQQLTPTLLFTGSENLGMFT